jgi:Holliday junction resolvase RusA-like endonuclease
MMKAAASKRYRRLAKEAVESERVETIPWKVISVKATFFFKTDRRRDQDNAVGSIKAAYDGIVDSGLVSDDDYESMKRGMPEFFVDKANPRVMLEITRCE